MAKKNRTRTDQVTDCACVIHSSGYDWIYVERLHNMLNRWMPGGARLHVFTEHDRSVPPHMVKHVLEDWPGIAGPKKSWWYKIQMFNPAHHLDNFLYFDLDCVIVADLTWMTQLHTDYFWTLKDFRYLQRPSWNSMNSSVMWWNVSKFSWVWDEFNRQGHDTVIRRWPGDQDFINATIDHNKKRYFDVKRFQSWRWQAWDGGMNFQLRKQNTPGAGTHIDPDACALIFHGQPKPHQIQDPIIENFWK